ncbi:T9SS type A sorting domain-containing protein [Seonamhaeicola sediminis]|uniref:T9SS type A sorting domain-containing protein n=1 Tax=Seonamhaeicola sediminis TaxID=2528206 RepID=A0A562YI00_9FLAO|nr:spondin domain-containing protein [Seonamhaeicola sediminis]TWO34337.1 T9SS type A sorting domain-containing protein [Seonamhaeicola sediminis]
MGKTTLFFVTVLFISSQILSQSIANYDIVFESDWDSETNDPLNGCSTVSLPSNAHWSPLVGATHATTNTFLEMGQMASAGVELVAETGTFSTFQTEITSNPDANQFINGGDLASAKGTISVNNLEVNENYPLLTLASMIAPTPDWFIAINSYNLRNGSSWVTSATIDLFPYDAGTEDGSGYSLSNPETNPRGVITSRSNMTPFNEKKIGTITITLKQVLNTSNNELNNISFYPNPANHLVSISNPQNIELKSIEIYSVLGKLSKTFYMEYQKALDLDLSDLKSGIYLIKFNEVNGFSRIQKLIIQ